MLYEDKTNHMAYALKAAWMEIGSAPYLASLRMDQATTWEEFREACAYSRIPAENGYYGSEKYDSSLSQIGIRSLRNARGFGAPVIVHVVTRKGMGYAPAEADEAEQMHSTVPIDPITGVATGYTGGQGISVAGNVISAKPQRGPEFMSRTSFAIFMRLAATELSAPLAQHAPSCAPCASKWFGASWNVVPASLPISAAMRRPNSGCVLSPVPTAVPPIASSRRSGSVALTRAMPCCTCEA